MADERVGQGREGPCLFLGIQGCLGPFDGQGFPVEFLGFGQFGAVVGQGAEVVEDGAFEFRVFVGPEDLEGLLQERFSLLVKAQLDIGTPHRLHEAGLDPGLSRQVLVDAGGALVQHRLAQHT